MRCGDCIDGEIDPAECCDRHVAEVADYVRGFRETLEDMVRAADETLAELNGQVMAMASDEIPSTLHDVIGALIRADYERRSCGGVIDGLLDDFGTADLRALRRDLR